MFENPFRARGSWYRANLHAHTTISDGNLSPKDCAQWYRSAGYDILAITDHDHVTTVDGVSGLLLLSGVELSGGRSRQGTDHHIVGLNVRAGGPFSPPAGATAQQLVDVLREDGGETFIAHPYWSGLMADDIRAIEGCFAVEVYNTGCDLEILRGFSTVHWDDLLTLGHDIGAVAVDDGHHSSRDHGLAWTMIKAEELSAEAVTDGLRRGRYYSSTGPEISDIELVDGKVRVETSPVASIAMVSAPGAGARTKARPGRAITHAEFDLPEARFCRIEVTDAEGKVAWSNPFLLDT